MQRGIDMKVLIAGYGRMGRLIEQTLFEAGDTVPVRIDTAEVAAKESDVLPSSRLGTLDKVADVIIEGVEILREVYNASPKEIKNDNSKI